MEVALDNQGSTAKIRNPVLVAVFSLITLGIYALYWWYQVNREMVDYDCTLFPYTTLFRSRKSVV